MADPRSILKTLGAAAHVMACCGTYSAAGIGSVLALSLVCAVMPVAAQEAEPGDAPPPAKVISKLEKSQLDALKDVKKRTKLALELMNTRLVNAEQLAQKSEYDAMFVELGAFQALIDDTLVFLSKSDKDSGKVLNNYKRFEIGLRAFAPRLEIVRRDLPTKYEFYVRRLAIYVRDARAKAVEPFFADSVVPNRQQ